MHRTFADVWEQFRADLPEDLPADEVAGIQAVFYIGAQEGLRLQREIATTEAARATRTERLMALPTEIAATAVALTTVHHARMRAQETL
jgi:hypothetical protein